MHRDSEALRIVDEYLKQDTAIGYREARKWILLLASTGRHNKAVMWIKQAKCALETGDVEGAIAFGLKVVEVIPKQVETIATLARAYFKLGKEEDMIRWRTLLAPSEIPLECREHVPVSDSDSDSDLSPEERAEASLKKKELQREKKQLQKERRDKEKKERRAAAAVAAGEDGGIPGPPGYLPKPLAPKRTPVAPPPPTVYSDLTPDYEQFQQLRVAAGAHRGAAVPIGVKLCTHFLAHVKIRDRGHGHGGSSSRSSSSSGSSGGGTGGGGGAAAAGSGQQDNTEELDVNHRPVPGVAELERHGVRSGAPSVYKPFDAVTGCKELFKPKSLSYEQWFIVMTKTCELLLADEQFELCAAFARHAPYADTFQVPAMVASASPVIMQLEAEERREEMKLVFTWLEMLAFDGLGCFEDAFRLIKLLCSSSPHSLRLWNKLYTIFTKHGNTQNTQRFFLRLLHKANDCL